MGCEELKKRSLVKGSYPMWASSVRSRRLVICAAAVLLSACNGAFAPPTAPWSVADQSQTVRTPLNHPLAVVLEHGGYHPAAVRQDGEPSWMAAEAQAQDLLYVSNVHDVTVYSYPQGKLEGKLNGFYYALGDCVDKAGNIWISDPGHNRMVEYAHGATKPRAVLKDEGGSGCAVDPTTGNLAVARGSIVSIFKNARGKPVSYSDPKITAYNLCGYDNKGNLFVDGLNGSNKFQFAELVRGGSKLTNITLDQAIGWPGGVQWDGKHVAIGDENAPVIYQFDIAGGRGMKVGTTPLGPNARTVFQYFIDGPTVVAPNECASSCTSDLLFFAYPAGGKATKKITKGIFYPRGTAVSKGHT